jgi:hypothetical protein
MRFVGKAFGENGQITDLFPVIPSLTGDQAFCGHRGIRRAAPPRIKSGVTRN